MKIDFIEETKANGESMYYTKINGLFVDKSLSYDKGKAYSIYQNIVKNGGKYNVEEVLESVTIP